MKTVKDYEKLLLNDVNKNIDCIKIIAILLDDLNTGNHDLLIDKLKRLNTELNKNEH